MNPRLVALGSLFLFASSLITFQTGLFEARLPVYATAVVTLSLAVGSVTFETIRKSRSL